MQFVFLSHDVDWRRQGPPLKHILARKDRFDQEILDNATSSNPYYNIPDYMNIEERLGLRSTFFFRTFYEGGSYLDYENDIRSLIEGGWEVGLHTDPSSIHSYARIMREKIKLEELTKQTVKANRVHYLATSKNLPHDLADLGFIYDSSVRRTKYLITKDEIGYYKIGNLIEFPITIMDAYLFTYMKINENGIIPLFDRTLNYSKRLNPTFNVITVIWHDNVLKMKGGRMYEQVLEYLISKNDVKVFRGIDLANIIFNNAI
jgi:peptidoglycan/xylan/chitin deacetylase (PgdA/CDA1 family)